MNTKTTIAIFAAVAILAAAIAPTFMNSASAAITPHCRNGGGNEPQGNCNGQGLKMQNENPAGTAPPGQNKP
jgi:hypothetical protein